MFFDSKKLKDVSVSALEDAIASAIAELIGSENAISCSIGALDFQNFGSVNFSSVTTDSFDIKP